MIPKNTSKIVRFLLRNTEKPGYNINQIARATKTSVGSAFKILKALEKNKVVTMEAMGNALYYTLNLDNLEAVKLCELLLIEEKRNLKGYSKLYAESLQNFDRSEAIVLFGSVLANKEFNDVDVLFLTDKVRDVNKFCLELAKLRTKPVVPLILKKKDFIQELKNKNEAVLSIVKKGIVIKGESVFLEAIKNAKK